MHPESGFQIAPTWPEIKKMTITSQFADMTSSSSLRPSEFFPISTDWGELWIPNLVQMFPMY